MADERSHAIRFHLEPNQLVISSQNAEEGEANETIQTDYTGDETDIGFNAQYLQEFLNVIGDAKVAFEFKDGNSQAQLQPVGERRLRLQVRRDADAHLKAKEAQKAQMLTEGFLCFCVSEACKRSVNIADMLLAAIEATNFRNLSGRIEWGPGLILFSETTGRVRQIGWKQFIFSPGPSRFALSVSRKQ